MVASFLLYFIFISLILEHGTISLGLVKYLQTQTYLAPIPREFFPCPKEGMGWGQDTRDLNLSCLALLLSLDKHAIITYS